MWEREKRPGTGPTMKQVINFLKTDDLSQLQAPLPKWGGKTNPGITVGHRADIDLIDWSKNEESKKEAGPHYVFIMQDRASRYIWTRPFQNETQK